MSSSIPQKRCSKCHEYKPATNEYFHRNCASKDGLYHRCKTCHNYKKEKEQLPEGMKRCTKCKNILPATDDYFYADPRTKKDGLYGRCKECFLIDAKAWRDKDVEKSRAVALDSYYRHHDKRLIAGKRYRDENPDRWKNKNRKWMEKNPEKVRIMRRKRIARENNAEGYHTSDDIKQLYEDQEGRCAYCGITLYQKYHVDHIKPLSKGGSNWPDNLACTCRSCNLSKADKMLEEWMKIRGW